MNNYFLLTFQKGQDFILKVILKAEDSLLNEAFPYSHGRSVNWYKLSKEQFFIIY